MRKLKYVKLFESFSTEEPMIFDYNRSELDNYKKDGRIHDYLTFYPRKPGGSSFTIASDQDVREMRELLRKNNVSVSLGNVGFGPYYHNDGKNPKSMVVIVQSEKDKKIVYDIIDRNFSLNYPTHQLGGW